MGVLLGAPIPDDPRVLLLGPNQRLNDEDHLLRERYIPTYRDSSDIVVRLSGEVISDRSLTAGVARALLLRRRENQRVRGSRVGGVVVAAGVLVGGAGDLAHSQIIEGLGGALFLAGSGLVTFVHNRGDIRVPASILDAAPPIRAAPATTTN